MTARHVIIEADGGSRGNPGPAAYGALVKDADTGRVLAEEGTTIGVASNNVAEYRGLIAGLTMAAQVAPDADIEVRMDSKLVVEQMSGNWKIKHADMRPLALQAKALAPFGTTYTWVPREQNKHADRLANEALDGLTAQLTETDAEVAEATASRDKKVEEIDHELADLEARRAPVVAEIPADLLALYDRLRESKGGVGAALLRARSCGGCMLDLDHAELATIRAAAPDDVMRCDNCSRILVRTSESGI